MARAQAENVIKNIIGDIVQRCALKGHEVSETLSAFMIKAVVLDPRNGFNVDRTLTSQDVQKLAELCLHKLTEKCSPFLNTIQMQVYFDLNYTSRREFVAEIHQVVESKLSPVSRAITDLRVKTQEDLEALYYKIINYILLRSGMGSMTDTHVLHETTAALQSVFPQTELDTFVALRKRDKEQQLKELSMLVTGVRLFNRTTKKDEKEVDVHDLMPEVLSDILPVSSKSIERELSDCERLVWKYTAIVEKLTDPDRTESEVSLELLKQALYNVRQLQVFLTMLLADAKMCAQRVEALQTELMAQLKLLKDTVQTKTTVPSAQVFPMFTALSRLWSGLQDEAELLHIFNNIMQSLRRFLASQAKIFSEEYLDSLLQGSVVKTDRDRMNDSADERIDPAGMKSQEWFLPETTSPFEQLTLQYNGFCGHALVNRDGLLLPGNAQIGVLKYKEKFYVFSSKDAALKFASTPDEFIAEVAEKAKRCPELIQLLRLHQQFSCITPYSELRSGENLLVRPITKSESSTQTDTHPLESHLDRVYEWNEWALRRKAIQLADLLSKQTHSTQTNVSHIRRDNTTQTYPSKNAECQTKRDSETNVPRPIVFLAGLKGQREGRVVKMDLTKSVNE